MNIDFKGDTGCLPAMRSMFTPQGERVFHLNLPISEGSRSIHIYRPSTAVCCYLRAYLASCSFQPIPSGDISTAAMVSTPFENVRDGWSTVREATGW